MKQETPSLFGSPDAYGGFTAADVNSSAPDESVPRLARQARQILERLRQGTATNRELCDIGLKYNARISELRQAGHDVRCVEHDHTTGVAVYQLFEAGEAVDSVKPA